MKRIYLLLATCGLTIAQAQVPNNGFEEVLSDGFSLKNWGSVFVQQAWMDPVTGESGSDEIWFQGGNNFSMAVGDCITGSWALMVTNAYNATKQESIAGHAALFNDELSETANGWNLGIPVPDGVNIDFLGFDYKFFPMGNDIAVAKLELFNENNESVGVAEIQIAQAQSNFQYVYVPVAFALDDTPKFMTITFNMQKDGSEVNFGTALIVDNVVVNTSMLGVRQNQNQPFTIYPTLVEDHINVMANNVSGSDVTVTIFNVEGKELQRAKLPVDENGAALDITKLASGVYLLYAESGTEKSTTRFIKK